MDESKAGPPRGEAISIWCDTGATGGTVVHWVRRRGEDEGGSRRAVVERSWEFVDWGTRQVDVPFRPGDGVVQIVDAITAVLSGDRTPGDVPGLIPTGERPIVDDDARLALLTGLLVVGGEEAQVHYSLSSALMREVSEGVDRALKGDAWEAPDRGEADPDVSPADALRGAISRVAGRRDPTPSEQFPTYRRT